MKLFLYLNGKTSHQKKKRAIGINCNLYGYLYYKTKKSEAVQFENNTNIFSPKSAGKDIQPWPVALISSDCFESFSRLSNVYVTEGVITTRNNRMQFTLPGPEAKNNMLRETKECIWRELSMTFATFVFSENGFAIIPPPPPPPAFDVISEKRLETKKNVFQKLLKQSFATKEILFG